MMPAKIITTENKKDEKFLRRKTADFDFKKLSRRETDDLVRRMKAAMKEARGIGLSANQIGVGLRVFVAEVPDRDGGSKFYAVFNPKVEKVAGESAVFEEGCLSVPGTFGQVERPSRIVLTGQDRRGKQLRIKAWGLLARVFQHETDHLNGKLFVDKAKNIQKVEELENKK